MREYLNLLQDVLIKGTERNDRTGVGTRAVFGRQMRFDLSHGFPAVTTKKLAFRSVIAELIWFLRGSQDINELRKLNCRIWDDNVDSSHWKPHQKFIGDAGRTYGVQWRRWRGADGREIDQLKKIIDWIKTNPHTRRMLVTAWNPAELDVSYDPENPRVALSPCHVLFQFFVDDDKLSLQMYQRSADLFLGVPFNIASYSLLLHIMAVITGLKTGEFIHVLGDTHIYRNHLEQVQEQLKRTPLNPPTLILNKNFSAMRNIGELDLFFDDFMKKIDSIWKIENAETAKIKVSEALDSIARLEGYESHPAIKAKMAA